MQIEIANIIRAMFPSPLLNILGDLIPAAAKPSLNFDCWILNSWPAGAAVLRLMTHRLLQMSKSPALTENLLSTYLPLLSEQR